MTGSSEMCGKEVLVLEDESIRRAFGIDATPNLPCDLGPISYFSVASDSPSINWEAGGME